MPLSRGRSRSLDKCLLNRGSGVPRADSTSRGVGSALSAGPVEVVEQGASRWTDLVEDEGCRGHVQATGRERVQPAAAAPDRVGHAGQRAEAAGALPGHGQVDQSLGRRFHPRRVCQQDRTDFVLGGLAEDNKGIKDEEFCVREMVERAKQ